MSRKSKNILQVPSQSQSKPERFTQETGAAALSALKARIGYVASSARFAKQYPQTAFGKSAQSIVDTHEMECRRIIGVKSLTYSLDVGTDRPAHADMGTIAEILLGRKSTMRIFSIHTSDSNALKAISARKTKALAKS